MHASSDRLQHAGTKVGVVLSALYYLGKEGLSIQVVSTICNNINRDELIKLKSSRMPAWMRSAVLLMDEAATATSNPNIGS